MEKHPDLRSLHGRDVPSPPLYDPYNFSNVIISADLGKAALDILKQIIDFRIKQRKERKKAFWMKVLSIAATVIGVVSMIVMLFAPWVGIGLGLVKGAIDVIQSALAGDWLGAIFKGILAVANFATKGLGQIISKVGNCGWQKFQQTETFAIVKQLSEQINW